MNQFVKTYKKRVSGIISLLLTVCLVSAANAEQVFYCSSELATGIIKKNGEWRTAPFKPERYTVKFNSDYTKVEGFHDSADPYNCHVPFSFSSGLLSCSGEFDFLLFDREKLRFTLFEGSPGGYTFDSDKPDTVTMEAGTCEAF